jgi:hypothetical protein
MEQRVETPTDKDLARIEELREWVRGFFEAASQPLYEEYNQKLRLLNAILRNGWIEPSKTWELQSLGIALGDALVQRCGFEWVVVEDEHGRDPALRLPGTTIIVYPLTMISKRVEKGESVDVSALIDGVAQKAEELRARFQEPT